ncbi:hypothetical protein CLOP_g8993, partial [Closterium sp. NIES-67]
LPDPEHDYVIEADASVKAVGAVLMQDQGNRLQPIVYLSKKLHGAELNYRIHDKEALPIIIAFKTWRCYLKGRKTTVYTDHCSPKYLKTQPTISRRQVRWIDFLETHFHYDIVNKPGHKNKADALTRPTHVAAIQLFIANVIRLHGLPIAIISDRDPKFTSNFGATCGTNSAPNYSFPLPTTHRPTGRLNESTKLWSKSFGLPILTHRHGRNAFCYWNSHIITCLPPQPISLHIS